MVLFSATPYRNDLRMFRIGRAKDGYRYRFTYPNALAIGLVRSIKLEYPECSFCTHERITGTIKRDAHVFAEELMRFYTNVLLSQKPANVQTPRVIVRCNSQHSVEQVQEALLLAVPKFLPRALGDGSIIGIHEEFNNKEAEWRFTHPPAPGGKGSSAIFWVHQYKLVEGIDNNEFCCVAFFEPFDNARSLVQQIGRIVRNPSGSKKETGFVFSDRIDHLDEQWSGYMSFEETDQDIIGAEDIVESIREAQPRWFYADRKYRQGVDFYVGDYWEDIRVPATSQIYLRPTDYDPDALHRLALQIEQQIELREVVHVKTLEKTLGNGRFCVTSFYWKIVQSSHFFERGFFDVTLLVSHLYMNAQYIFYQGLVSLETACGPQSPEKIEIENLLSALPAGNSHVKEMSLINSDMGDMAVRRRSMGGRSLEFASAALNDHLHFVTSCICSQKTGRRYIGLSKARITDSQSQFMSLIQYHEWLEELTRVLTNPKEHKDTSLRRFAPAIRKPTSAKAKHLLLDLNEFTDVYRHTSVNGHEEDGEAFEATACEVADDGSFECWIRGESFKGNISYEHGRFVIRSDNLNDLWRREDGVQRSAVSFLASNTVLRVVTEAGQIYADGRFYSPARLRGKHRFTDLDIFVELPALGKIIKKEKGDTGIIERTTWQEGSIFRVIDSDDDIFNDGRLTPSILICDDSSGEHYEMADFVAIQTGDKKGIALIHAKNGSGAGSLSVGNLHEVVSQAKKNLGVFDPSEDLPDTLARKWNGVWKTGKKTLSRIRRPTTGALKGREIVNALSELRSHPATEKEVWLVLGNMFGKREITEVITSSGKVEYHWIQMLYLLHSLHASVTAVGARLRVLVGQ